MKKISTIILLLATVFISVKAQSQSILPTITDELCPLKDITFIVQVPGQPVTNNSILGSLGATTNGVRFNQSNSGSNYTFSFTGRFADQNATQRFTITYINPTTNQNVPFNFDFVKVKSLATQGSGLTALGGTPGSNDDLSAININPIKLVPLCTTTSFNLSFTQTKYLNKTTNAYFGAITNYKYLLPLGWKLGTITSTGSFMTSTNNVTITPDATTGGTIQIKPANDVCINFGNSLIDGRTTTITIQRSAPTFSISPSTVSIVCNTPKTQIFTINQSGSSACNYSYVWELGANNGWIYNGADAPQTINTTTNTITLTSCGLFQKNINAKAITGSTQYAANASIISNNCNYSITGNATFCTFSDFSINNLPTNANVVWSLSNSTTASLSCTNCPSTRVIKTGTPSNVTLTASVTVPGCNSILLLNQQLTVGSTLAPLNMIPSYGLDCNSINLFVDLPYATVTYTTTNGLLINGNASPYTTTTNNTVSISAPAQGVIGTVSAASTNPCDRDINNYNFGGGCIDWAGGTTPTLVIMGGAPLRGEPLHARIDPTPEWINGATYHWFINGNFLISDYSPNLTTYDWPCNYGNGSILSVIAVVPEGNGYKSTAPISGDFVPACIGARIASTNTSPSIYPNPASTIVTIKLEEILNESGAKTDSRTKNKVGLPVQIKIIDKLGNIRKMYRFINNEKIVTINVADIPSDLYYIEINNGITNKKMQLKIAR